MTLLVLKGGVDRVATVNLELPDLNRSIAFIQANSAGLTLNLLNLLYISARWLMRDTDSEDITSYSVMVNNEGFSKGKHH